MSRDIACPECGEYQEINHDDGYGYEEGVRHEQNCVHCNELFYFETSIIYSYEAFCSKGHDLYQDDSDPRFYHCHKCEFIGTEDEVRDE